MCCGYVSFMLHVLCWLCLCYIVSVLFVTMLCMCYVYVFWYVSFMMHVLCVVYCPVFYVCLCYMCLCFICGCVIGLSLLYLHLCCYVFIVCLRCDYVLCLCVLVCLFYDACSVLSVSVVCSVCVVCVVSVMSL